MVQGDQLRSAAAGRGAAQHMDATQRFSFDVAGICVVEDCLGLQQLELLRAVIAQEIPEVGSNRSITPTTRRRHEEDSDAAAASASKADGFWHQALFDLVDHSKISPILEELFAGDDHRHLGELCCCCCCAGWLWLAVAGWLAGWLAGVHRLRLFH